jgi:hypothetical protein
MTLREGRPDSLGAPFVFALGFPESAIPARFGAVVICKHRDDEKPVDLFSLFGPPGMPFGNGGCQPVAGSEFGSRLPGGRR